MFKKIIDGKKVVVKGNSKNIPPISVIKDTYSKIPDNKRIPVVFETKEQYLDEYIKNQEKSKKTQFKPAQIAAYKHSELANMSNIVSRYTTDHNPFIDRRVVFFNDHKIPVKQFKDSAVHEYGHELWEKNPKIRKDWKSVSNSTSPTPYGRTAKQEDFAESYMLHKKGMLQDPRRENIIRSDVAENRKILPWHGNIEKQSINNPNYRKVVETGSKAQLVLMSLKPKEEIGNEVHPKVDQFFRIEQGRAKFSLANGKINYNEGNGGAVFVPAGTWHNVINPSANKPLKLYTIYSPPNHPVGTIQKDRPAKDRKFFGVITNEFDKSAELLETETDWKPRSESAGMSGNALWSETKEGRNKDIDYVKKLGYNLEEDTKSKDMVIRFGPRPKSMSETQWDEHKDRLNTMTERNSGIDFISTHPQNRFNQISKMNTVLGEDREIKRLNKVQPLFRDEDWHRKYNEETKTALKGQGYEDEEAERYIELKSKAQEDWSNDMLRHPEIRKILGDVSSRDSRLYLPKNVNTFSELGNPKIGITPTTIPIGPYEYTGQDANITDRDINTISQSIGAQELKKYIARKKSVTAAKKLSNITSPTQVYVSDNQSTVLQAYSPLTSRKQREATNRDIAEGKGYRDFQRDWVPIDDTKPLPTAKELVLHPLDSGDKIFNALDWNKTKSAYADWKTEKGSQLEHAENWIDKALTHTPIHTIREDKPDKAYPSATPGVPLGFKLFKQFNTQDSTQNMLNDPRQRSLINQGLMPRVDLVGGPRRDAIAQNNVKDELGGGTAPYGGSYPRGDMYPPDIEFTEQFKEYGLPKLFAPRNEVTNLGNKVFATSKDRAITSPNIIDVSTNDIKVPSFKEAVGVLGTKAFYSLNPDINTTNIIHLANDDVKVPSFNSLYAQAGTHTVDSRPIMQDPTIISRDSTAKNDIEDDFSWDTAEHQNKLVEENRRKEMSDKERYEHDASEALANGQWRPSYEEHIKNKKTLKKDNLSKNFGLLDAELIEGLAPDIGGALPLPMQFKY